METLASGAAAPANAELAPVETPEADAEGSPATSEGSAPSAPEASTPAPKKDPVQERIDKLTRDKYDALRERDRKDYELERLRAEVEQFKAPKTEVATQNDFPTLEQFGYDEGKYQAAVAQHFSKLAAEQGTVAARQALEAERQRQQQEQLTKNWATQEAEFMKSKPDYAEKVRREPRDGGPVISQSMADLIKASPVGAAVAYHLAENVEKSAAIAALPPIEQAREIGRIEARLEAAKQKPAPAVSQAPQPIPKVDADEAPVTVKVDSAESDALSDKEWTRRRNLQEQARLRKARGG